MPGLPKVDPAGSTTGGPGGGGVGGGRPGAVDRLEAGGAGPAEPAGPGGGAERTHGVGVRRRGPRHPGRRVARVTARLSEAEEQSLRAAAERAGLTVAGFVAAAALAAAAGQPAPRPRAGGRELLTREALLAVNQARAQLRHVGGNLNQLAKAANTTGELPPNLSQVLELVQSAVAEVDAATVRLSRRRPE